MADLHKLGKQELIRQLRDSQAALASDAREEKRLLHDLQVHQIELELQNRELREAQQALEVARDCYADLYDFAPVGYLTLDEHGVISEANLTASLLLEAPRQELIGRPLGAYIAKKSKTIFYHHLKETLAQNGDHVITEITLQPRSGEPRQVRLESAASPPEEGDPVSRTVIVDIGALKRTEDQLRAAKHEADRANEAKSAFLARMSHELRTPMNAILGFSQLLLHEGELPKGEHREAVEHIFAAGTHLLCLINEVLNIANIDANQMQLSIEDVSLDTVFNSTLMLVRNLALQKGVTITELPAEIPWVHADTGRLTQIMVNLLSNAIKYNRKGGTVSITFEDTAKGRIRINIADTGIGIKPADLTAVFEPFYRVAAKGQTIEGSGIGLSVVKKLVEAMNGQIGVESEYGRGSTFWIELPQVQSTAAPQSELDASVLASIAELNIESGPKKILYVEDNPASRNLMQSIFKRLPAWVLLSASDAEIGLDIARNRQPDLILMDLDLPGMDGFQALERLNNDHATATIPVIAVSAHAMPECVAKGIGAGFNEYVTKPIQIDQLIAAMKCAFKNSRT